MSYTKVYQDEASKTPISEGHGVLGFSFKGACLVLRISRGPYTIDVSCTLDETMTLCDHFSLISPPSGPTGKNEASQ